MNELIEAEGRSIRHLQGRALTLYSLVSNAGNIIFYLVIGGIIFLIPQSFVQLTDNTLIISLIMLYLIRPISEIMLLLPALREATIAFERLQQLRGDLNSTEHNQLISQLFELSTITLQFKDVTFCYQACEGGFEVGPLNLEFNSGQLNFIIGGNGSGKTSFAMLLLGLYTPVSGKIFLNGTEITSEKLVTYRESFIAIFADFHLFPHITASDHNNLHERTLAYLRDFKLDHVVTVSEWSVFDNRFIHWATQKTRVNISLS